MGLYDDILRSYQNPEVASDLELTRQGSVMAGTGDMNTYPAGYPTGNLLGDILKFAFDKLGQAATRSNQTIRDVSTGKAPPSEAMNVMGPSAIGMISPTAKSLSDPAMLQGLERFGKNFPGMFRKVLASPKDLVANILQPSESMAFGGATGLMRELNPALAQLKMVDPSSTTTMAHELQHFLNYPRFSNMAPEDAATIGSLLSDVLPQTGQSSLRWRTGQFVERVNDAIKKAGGMKSSAIPGSGELYRAPGTGQKAVTSRIYRVPESARAGIDAAQVGMGQEGLAHLAERTVFPGADPQLLELARRLGVGTGMEPTGELMSSVLPKAGGQ